MRIGRLPSITAFDSAAATMRLHTSWAKAKAQNCGSELYQHLRLTLPTSWWSLSSFHLPWQRPRFQRRAQFILRRLCIAPSVIGTWKARSKTSETIPSKFTHILYSVDSSSCARHWLEWYMWVLTNLHAPDNVQHTYSTVDDGTSSKPTVVRLVMHECTCVVSIRSRCRH